MSSWILILSTLFCAVCLGGFHLYALQSNGYHTVFKRQTALFGVIIPIFIGVLGYLLERYFEIGDYVVASILVAIGIFSLIKYLKKRTKFRYTARGTRVAVAYYIMSSGLSFLILIPQNKHLVGAVVGLSGCCILALVNGIIAPFEHRRNFRYAYNKTAPLRENDIVKVVITGSYGKTSSKRILTELLRTKYQVVSTLHNHNTPLGLAKSVESQYEMLKNAKNLTKTVVFVGEAGARRKGDIKEMCKLIAPQYGIITGVAEQHLDSFKNVENIANTKEELANYIGANGVVVFNVDNPHTEKMSSRFCGKAINVGSGGDIEIKNLKLTAKGSTFELDTARGVIPLKTELLGAHNAKNIALCVALALELGIEVGDIIMKVSSLKPEPHRLEKRVSGGITILDDSYNANLLGVESALNVLKDFDGRKVIYAQGIVECGQKKGELNKRLARAVAKVADIVILSGENAKIIYNELKKCGFQGKIYQFSTLMHATSEFKNILTKGDILYLQNDIP